MPTVDGVTLSILRSYFQAAADAMGHVVERTSCTTFVKETADFAVGICTPQGEFFCYPRDIGVSTFIGLDLGAAISRVPTFEEGDIIITNDPYTTNGVSTHLPDVHMYKPIFHDGRVIAFSWAFVHCSDVGGIVPTSVAATSEEVFQEGLRIPPQKLYGKGRLNQALLDVILANCRTPEDNWGDFKAMLAGINTGEQRLLEMVAKFGGETVTTAANALLSYTEARARAVIESIPDGAYSFTDYLEDDARTGIPVRIAVRLSVRGSDAHLDFTGTDPQVRAAYNVPTGGERHPFLCTALVIAITTLDPGIPLNSGIIRPISMTLPTGSVVNPQFPAACGTRYATVIRVHDVILGALGQALPDQIPAAGAGQSSPVALSVFDLMTGRRRVAVLQAMMGGSGGRPQKDGVAGCDTSLGYLRNTPSEVLEADVPVIIHRYELLIDTAGVGRHRGGAGHCLEFEVRAPEAAVVARSQERFKFQPWGVLGGGPGAPARTRLYPGSSRECDIGKKDLVRLQAGDVIVYETPGGGGYGDPLEREPERVAADVRSGLVSDRAAREDYGVVLRDGNIVDDAKTVAVRARMAGRRRARFNLGVARTRYDAVWTADALDDYSARLTAVSPHARAFVQQLIHERVIAPRLAAGDQPISPEDLELAWRAIEASGRGLTHRIGHETGSVWSTITDFPRRKP
jgi:N-methylhydantoinase B